MIINIYIIKTIRLNFQILLKLQNFSDTFREKIDQFRIETLENEKTLILKLKKVREEVNSLVDNYKRTVLLVYMVLY